MLVILRRGWMGYRGLKSASVFTVLARFLSRPEKMDWGEWLAVFVDPDGNEVDLNQPVDPSKWTD